MSVRNKQRSSIQKTTDSTTKGASHPKGSPIMVGIGASAGGLHPLQTLLQTISPDSGMAFVVVMHIDPNRESGLPDVLRTHTTMPVVQVTEDLPVEPNHVYVIPPNKRLLATDHSLSVGDFDEPRGKRVPVDHLFRSLADVHSDHVIGIILSGSGTDGAVGMKAIKEQGGVLMVQSPDEAEFNSMPRAAIATGLVDFVLPVKEIGEHLGEFSKHGSAALKAPENLVGDSSNGLQEVLKYLHSRVGHDFSHYKQSSIQRRVGRRMQVNKVHRLPDYLDLLRRDNREPEALFNDLLIGVTTFFRDPAFWRALEKNVVPRIFENKSPNDSVRAWVAGCSSGEEAYSLAILLLEYADTLEASPNIQVFASDIGEDNLAIAREALYPDGIEADLSRERLARFFTREGNYFRAKKELRESVVFATHDLLRDPPFSKLDLISCRNLLIYLEREMQERVFEIFHYALRPRGYLFLGSSEALISSNLFHTVDKFHRIHQARDRQGELPHLPALPLAVKQPPHLPEHGQDARRASELRLHQTMLEHHAPPSILIDESYSVAHLSENAGRYLTPSGGTLSHDITKLVRPELRFELRGALQTAFHNDQNTVTRPTYVKFNGEPVPVSMFVRINPKREDSERLALIIFLENAEARIATEETPHVKEGDETVVRLEAELHHARLQLQSTIEESDATTEELKAANEELQSMNEEYRSTTEELETSREELQSINEELQTVNNELKSKLDEVSRAHSDLQNLMAATDIGTLFLDRELRIKRYTPRIHDLFNIVSTDIGRPIGHFTHAFEYDDLIPTAKKVLSNLRLQEAEIQGRDKCWYLMRLRPYRTVEDKIDGVVITFVDITERRKAEEALRASEENYRILLENVREYGIFTMDTHRRITTWNTGAQRIFGYTEEEAIGKCADIIFTDEDRQNGAPLREMETAAKNGEASDDRLHRTKDGSTFWASGILAALYDHDGSLRGYAKVLRDNTDRKEAEDRLREINESLEERVQERTKEVRTLASTLTMAEQEERRRISQILHDHLQQLLYSVQMKLTRLKEDSGDAPPRKVFQKKAREAYDAISDAIQTTRRLTVDLNPPVLKGEGLTDALQWLVSLMEEVYELRVDLIAESSFPIPDEDMRHLLFQIVRELLFNVVKHAETKHTKVELKRMDGCIVIVVSDKGKGFDVASAEKRQEGLGLFGVRERLNLFGGKMDIESQPGKGTRITAVAPLDRSKQNDHVNAPGESSYE